MVTQAANGRIGPLEDARPDFGGGVAVTPRCVVTAMHVISDRPAEQLLFRTESGMSIGITRVERAPELDAAILYLERDAPDWLPARPAFDGDRWRAASPPGEGAALTGDITRASIEYRTQAGKVVNVVQLTVDQDFHEF